MAWRKFFAQRSKLPLIEAPVDPPPSADQAWKALSLIVDWIKHAETKAAATIAGTAAVGVALFNLVKDATSTPWYFLTASAICGVLALGAGFCASFAIWPRLRGKEPPTSLLYFQHIARAHTTADGYAASLVALTKDVEALVGEIARQGWANSRVAHQKYIWGARAIILLLTSLVMLAASALIRLIDSI
ncbi:Pycsar system effector family protein [Nonomuraea cavernae]|uniref:Pycsar system effector family protein n=1 Tax=Nonomuraea cavernae TaxID=2045107 RepID=UPI0035709C22